MGSRLRVKNIKFIDTDEKKNVQEEKMVIQEEKRALRKIYVRMLMNLTME